MLFDELFNRIAIHCLLVGFTLQTCLLMFCKCQKSLLPEKPFEAS